MINAAVLVLNRHYQPIHVTTVRRAFALLYQGLAQAVDRQYRTFDFPSWAALSAELGESIGTPSQRIRIPRVILLHTCTRFPRGRIRFSRLNIYLRDDSTCQYCGRRMPRAALNLDHVIPRSRGGTTTWENIVCSCVPCNLKKGGRTPDEAHMALLRKPFRPHWSPLVHRGLRPIFHEAWRPFLSDADVAYWNTELQP